MTKLARDGLFPFILDNFFVVLFVCFYLLICSFLSKVELLSKTHVMLNQLTTVRKKKMLCSAFCFIVSKSQGSVHTSHTISRGATVQRSFQKDVIGLHHKSLFSVTLPYCVFLSRPLPPVSFPITKGARKQEHASESRVVRGWPWGHTKSHQPRAGPLLCP